MQGPLKIVLVDDDQGVLRALGLVLQTLGHQTALFTSGIEALTYLSHSPGVDIVVSDLRMPIMDGAEVLRQVRQMHPTIPVVMMSGHATPNDRATLIALGARAVLSKPFSPQELLALAEHETRAPQARGKVA
jgi:two-component system response regulator GlrR